MNNVIITSGAGVLLALSFVLFASEQIPQDESHPAIQTEPDPKPGLEQRMSPEERQRFNYNLQNHSNTVYPEFDQIETRRSQMRQKIQERFHKVDSDHDNSISRLEAEESMPGLARHFDEIDVNHDNIITYDEMKGWYDKKREMLEPKPKNKEAMLPVDKTTDSKKRSGKTDPTVVPEKVKRKKSPPDTTSSISMSISFRFLT